MRWQTSWASVRIVPAKLSSRSVLGAADHEVTYAEIADVTGIPGSRRQAEIPYLAEPILVTMLFEATEWLDIAQVDR